MQGYAIFSAQQSGMYAACNAQLPSHLADNVLYEVKLAKNQGPSERAVEMPTSMPGCCTQS